MNNEQKNRIEEYTMIKKHIKACFDMKKFTEIMKESIIESKSFEFSSERSMKFIDVNSPKFMLKTSLLDGVNLRAMNDQQVNSVTETITKHLQDEIISKISENMMSCLLDKDKYSELVNIDPDLVDLLITNIYKIRIDRDKNLVQFEYFSF